MHSPTFIAVILVLSQLAFAVPTAVHARDLAPARIEMKSMMLRSMQSQQGGQWVRLGPMRNGRTVKGYFEYRETKDGIETKPKGGGDYCISFDRNQIAVAAYMMDAAIICQTHGHCERLPAYFGELWAKSDVKAMPLFEEVEPRVSLSNWQRTKPYARAWLDLYQSFILAFQLHEIGHIALDHSGAGADTDIDRREGEADGFAVFTAALAGYNPMGGATMVVGEIHSNDEQAIFRACRAEAFATGLQAYFARHQPGWTGAARLPRSRGRTPHNSGFDLLRSIRASIPRRQACRAYSTAFKAGVEKAMALIDTSTPLNSGLEPGHRCR